MTEHDNQSSVTPEVVLPSSTSLVDRFWIDPAELGSVRDMVNSAHMVTMALGVESRRDEYAAERDLVKEALIAADDPLAKDKQLAVDVGFLYGALVIRSQTGPEDMKPEPQTKPELPDG